MGLTRTLAGALPLLLTLAGCAGIQRTEYLDRRAAEHVIARPITEVWPEAEGLLRDRGWSVQSDGELRLVTDWHKVPGGKGLVPTGRSETIPVERLVVEGTPLPEGHCVIKILRQERPWHKVEYGKSLSVAMPTPIGGSVEMGQEAQGPDAGHVSTEEQGPTPLFKVHRDLDLEWALIRRVEPSWAAAHEHVAADQYR